MESRFENVPQFPNPEEELRYLRSRVAEIEQKHWEDGDSPSSESITSHTIHEYVKTPSAGKQESAILDNPQFENAVSHLSALSHREKMREIYEHLKQRGIREAVALTRKMNNPHLEDDFHRVLVEYVEKGGVVLGLEKERALKEALHMNVFSIVLPPLMRKGGEGPSSKSDEIRSLIGVMEQMISGLLPTGGKEGGREVVFTLEIAQSNFSHAIEFFVGVPAHLSDLFVKHLLALFPSARMELHHDDYNIFNEFGSSLASYGIVTNSRFDRGGIKRNCTLPIKTQGFEEDPIKVLVNAFTHLERDGEGAAIQFILKPRTNPFSEKLRDALKEIKNGTSPSKALDLPLSVFSAVSRSIGESLFASGKNKENGKPKDVDQKMIEMIEQKLAKPILQAGIRVVASAGTNDRAKTILNHLESAFHQFTEGNGGRIVFSRIDASRLERLLYNFIYRLFDEEETLYLSTEELATLIHFPTGIEAKSAPQLTQASSAVAPAPSEIPHQGVLLGINQYQGNEREIRMEKFDRLRHLYVIGQTGTGKTTLLKNMVIDDIRRGEGVCFIDPHGTDVQDILAHIPKERIEDVIYFDPSYTSRPFGLNMLEYDSRNPQQKIFVVNELLSIFRKLYSAVPESMGPAFEQYFRNATMLVMEDPESGNTLLEISRVLADAQFRALKLSRCKNPIVVQFWRDIAAKSTGEASLANMTPYITNKFDVFLSNDIMRPIIAQEKSSFQLRDIMDNKKILLVNLAKGNLGEINSHLIGLILVGKILMAALSRVDSYGKELPHFYLYIDEFQNITTDSISSILSEARKYGLSLTIAHQFLGQIDEGIRSAVFGNVGNMAVFRVGAEDAEFLEKQFLPTFTAKDILSIDNRNAYVKMLVHGVPTPPFNMSTIAPSRGEDSQVENIKSLSYLKFGQDRHVVDELILKKYAAGSYAANNPPKTSNLPPNPS